MEKFKKGDSVSWKTVKGNKRKGTIVAVMAKDMDPHQAFYRLNQDKYRWNGDINTVGRPRDHKSYLIARCGYDGSRGGKQVIFWPPVSALKKA